MNNLSQDEMDTLLSQIDIDGEKQEVKKKIKKTNFTESEKKNIIKTTIRFGVRKMYDIRCADCDTLLTTQFVFKKNNPSIETLYCSNCGYYIKTRTVLKNAVAS